MKPFTDSAGRTWEVTVNVGAVRRVRDTLGVDLMDVAGGDLLDRLADDPVLLVDVLYVLVKPQADAKSVSDEDFGRAMVGGVIDEAASALMKELLDFFPSAQRARALAKMLRKMEEQQAAVTAAVAALKPLSEAEAATETPRQEAGRPGDSSGNSPAPAASTPTA
jgi:hypothetical protein